MLNLTVQHLIHLSKNQRYALHSGIELVVFGISIPVWHIDNVTSEPAKEVFCKYYLKNTKQDAPIVVRDDGFEIVLPYRQGKGLEITNEEWRELNFKNPEKLELMYQKCVQEVSSKNLLDIKDGGSGHMSYREHNKLKEPERILNVMHFVQIESMDKLENSLER